MAPPLFSYGMLFTAAILFSVAAAFLTWMALNERRQGHRQASVASIVIAALFIAGAALSGVAGYRNYVAANTWRFSYDLDIDPNGTAPEALIVPLPEDETLLAGLRVTSGVANWSLVDTAHGRGLYVWYAGDACLEAFFSEYPATGASHNTTPTLLNSTDHYGVEGVFWLFYSGGGAAVDWSMSSSPGRWTIDTWPADGWGTYRAYAMFEAGI